MWLITIQILLQDKEKPPFKGAAFYSPGLVQRALFQRAEVIVSRVYVVCGFHCIMGKAPPDVQVPDSDGKARHIIHELLCKQKNRYHSSGMMDLVLYDV